MKSLAIKTIERDFPNQWLLIEVTATKNGAPSQGIVLKAATNGKRLLRKSVKTKVRNCFSSLAEFPHRAIRLSR